jgi:ABC transporter with metal-binding/Fe-S-binding domain ATP-binding protein
LNVGILFSGGKDSTYSAYLAKQRDEIACLITLQPSREDSYMFHYPNVRWTALQAEAMGLPQVMVQTEGVKEIELSDLASALGVAKREYGIEGVYTGALASIYQKSRVDRISREQGLQTFSPLWGMDARTHLTNLVRDAFEVIITGVAALGLDSSWLGRRLDEKMVDDLITLQNKYGVNATLEGGEGETFVLDCPIFDMKVEVVSSEKHWDGSSGRLEIREATLARKSRF